MKSPKDHSDMILLLLQEILQELGDWCCTSTAMDLKTIHRRVAHEGISFLTISLPDFASDFQKSLEQGFVGPGQFPSFRRTGGLPRFLSGFLCLVFDSVSGRLLDVPDVDSIFAIRQITLLCSKLLIPCSDARVRKSIDGYVRCESELRDLGDFHPDDLSSFRRISSLLFAELFTDVESDYLAGRLIPKHGPGAVAERLSSNAKWRSQYWTQRLEAEFPFMENLASSYSLALSELEGVELCEPDAELPVRVVTVPKTLKTPRIIAIEPTAMMYIQQSILGSFVRHIERIDIPRNMISWSDRTPNQDMARTGSLSQDLATLDLSEASDRVSNLLVRQLLARHPHLYRAVDACRSRNADVPGYGVLPLTKFASMGSALCFPMESMVFLTLCFMGIEDELNRPLSKSDIYRFFGRVRVYGDDIIVPVDYVRSVIARLEAFGFKVNADKSFWVGKFRESCGKEYFSGTDVSITRLRRVFPSSRRCVSEMESLVAFRNLLYQAGLWRTVGWLDNILKGFIPWPIVEPTSPALGRHSIFPYDAEGYHEDYHSPFVKAAVVIRRSPRDPLDGYAALVKCLTYLTIRKDCEPGMPTGGDGHLERTGRPRSADIKTRRVVPF